MASSDGGVLGAPGGVVRAWFALAMVTVLVGCGVPAAETVTVEDVDVVSLSQPGEGSVEPAPNGTLIVGVQTPVGGPRPWPVPADGQDLYWRWVTEVQGERVLGRARVEVLVVDDGVAGSGCPAWPADVFMVTAWSDVSQVHACVPEADRAGLPYLLASPAGGSSSAALPLVPLLEEQLSLLVEFVESEFAGSSLGLVVPAGELFDEVAAVVDGTDDRGWVASVVRPDVGDAVWGAAAARELVEAGVDVAVVVGSAVDLVRLARSSSSGQVRYVMAGSNVAVDAVLQAGCPEVDGTLALAWVPPLAAAGAMADEFLAAADRFDVLVDDVVWQYWWLASRQHELLRWYEHRPSSAGQDREAFRQTLNDHPRARSAPPRGDGPAEQLHVLAADCASGTWVDHATLEVNR